MEEVSVYDTNANFVTEDKPKVAEMTKGKSRISGRKALANISNMPQGFTASNKDNKSGPSSDVLRKHIEQLQKEKIALMKQLAEKNKVIESGGTEMQKLSVTLEKVKQQNLQLAQSNSQMLVELNSVKERQKIMNHELGCKNCLIIAKNLELEEKDKTRMCQANDNNHNKVIEPEVTEVCTVADGGDDKHYANSRRQIPQNNDKGKSKRLQTRRQSAKFKFDEPKPTHDSLEMNIDDVPPCSLPDDDKHDDDDEDDNDDKMKANDSNTNASSPSSSSSKKEDAEGDSFQDYNKHQEHRKTLLSRPVREAAKKVQSYKEVNLVVKMRRE
ncbi:hypothetical protein R6Q59_029803 [Mikania micrantha]